MTNKKIYIQDDIVKDPAKDNFGHNQIAEAISESIINSDPPFIIGIFGGWGTGKSSLLQLIKKSLTQNKTESIYLDAWNYSTTNNLRRAFLVFMAKELDPEKLDELRRRLYSSEEQKITKNETFDKNFKKALPEKIIDLFISSLELIFTFVAFTIVIFLCVFLFDLVINVFMSEITIKAFISNYQIVDKIKEFKDILYIPFILILINKFPKINLHQNPVTIFHERIDAEELFAEYFEKIIQKKVVEQKKKLIIFIDNLDRLNDEKIIEALESIKTFATHPNCIFVVACDDNVVRKVINDSKNLVNLQNDETDGDSPGEHYLDKFFQQTFRIPEFMPIDLHDFAMKIFQTTKLYESFNLKKIDIRNLISIILPSDITSPRKVKRLLNDFIALHEIVVRRENEECGQLRKGAITENIEFLGKFSTLKSEYPEFYSKLRKKTNLLEEISNKVISDPGQLENYSLSLRNYIRKTITINVDNIEPYIWLSQDNLSLGLSREHHTQLRIDLANGNIDNIKITLSEFSDEEYKENYINVASRIVEQRLVGIEKQNGLKILMNLLPDLSINFQEEIAHLCAKILPSFQMNTFTVYEILNVIKYNKRSNIKNDNNKFIDRILQDFNNLENSKKTVELIINHFDSIESIGKTKIITDKINEIVISAHKKEVTPTLVDSFTIVECNLFSEWYVSLSISQNNLPLFQNYFSEQIVEYVFYRLIDEELNINIFDEISDPFSTDVFCFLETITQLINQGLISNSYWHGIITFLPQSPNFEETSYFINSITNSYDKLHPNLREKIILGLISGLRRASEISNDVNKLQNLLINGYKTVIEINKKFPENNSSQFEDLEIEINFLLGNKECFESTLDFIKDHISIFGEDRSSYLLKNLIEFFKISFSEIQMNKQLLNILAPIKPFLSIETKSKIIQIIFDNFSTNDLIKIKISTNCLLSLTENKEFSKLIASNQEKWINLINENDINFFKERLELTKELALIKVFEADTFISILLKFFPFENIPEKLEVFFETISKIWFEFKEENQKILIESTIDKESLLGNSQILALELIAPHLYLVDENNKNKFSRIILQNYSINPEKYKSMIFNSSQFLPKEVLKDHIKQMFEGQISNTLNITIETVQKLLNRFDNEEVVPLIEGIINSLYPIKQNAINFIRVILEILEIEPILKIRNNCVNSIYEKNNKIVEIEKNLLVLESTSRKYIREVKPIVDVFVYLFGKEDEFIELALYYIVDCLNPLKIRNDHKHILADAMGKAALRTESKDINQNIHDKAELLGLKWFSYRKYWES